MTRRALGVALVTCVTLATQVGSTWIARAQAPAPAAATPRANPQGGSGPIKVALITKGHAYDREGMNLLLDSLGSDITWSHVEHPAATLLWEPKNAGLFDVFVFYDAIGRVQRKSADGSITYDDPGAEAKRNLPALMQAGTKGWVFLHQQNGHDRRAWENPAYRTLLLNAIRWTASKEAKAWAAANAKTGTPAAWRPAGTN